MPFTEKKFREALGHFPTGVAIITLEEEGGGTLGMTVNSFTSLSLEPPLILWCLAKSSVNCDLFKEAGFFGVNILEENQKVLSAECAVKGKHHVSADLIQPYDHQDKESAHSIPLLRSALVSFACERHDIFDVGDHFIITGHVKHVAMMEGEPLLFHRGAYRKTHA